MSRSGYTEDDGSDNQWRYIMWRGTVASATRGKRGQKLLRDLLAALDAMPEKRLVARKFEAAGDFCALGVLGAQRGIDIKQFDSSEEDDYGDYDERIGAAFDIADPLAREIMWRNDECVTDSKWLKVEVCGPLRPHHWRDQRWTEIRVDDPTSPERRWQQMRAWVAKRVNPESTTRPTTPAP